ncbi:MAG: helix-turn-helix domain-containing protein [Prevotella sp.]|jgi:transcriptional regulator with XRE-family HTH domain|nr:helix-turn-helix domain-containing protein [Prevotella sp.]
MLEGNIHKKIKERRTLLGITQQDLADISGVALRTIKQVETGKGNPSVKTLDKIANVPGMYIDLVIKNPADI